MEWRRCPNCRRLACSSVCPFCGATTKALKGPPKAGVTEPDDLWPADAKDESKAA